MRTLARGLLGAAVAVMFVAAPSALHAQQQSEKTQESCTAEVTPAPIAPGQKAVAIQAELGQDIGAVTTLKAPEESGLALASPEDFGKQQMSQERGERTEPILMADEDNKARIWLNTADAKTGKHEVTLKGKTGTCTATVTVKKPSDDESGLF